MKYIALLFGLIISAWMLRREVRRRPIKRALWIPTLLVIVLGSRPISEWFSGHGGGANSTPSIIDEAFFLLVLASAFIAASMRGVNWVRFLAANIPIVLLYLFFVFSVLWSGDALLSGKRIVKDFALLPVVALVLSEKDPSEAIRAVYIRAACLWFPLSIICNRYFPWIARSFSPTGQMMLSGVTTQKNTLGEMVLVFGGVLLWDYLEVRDASGRKRFFIRQGRDQLILFAMGIFLLIQSQSKTALISLAIFMFFILGRNWLVQKPIRNLAFFGVFASPYLLFFTKEFGDLIQPIVTTLGRDMTFTGRTNIWAHINSSTVNPIIGSGYWNFWGSPAGLAISDSISWAIPNAHCGYLDIYLDGGICGLFVLFFVLFSYGRRLLKRTRLTRYQAFRLGLLSAAIVYNLSESSFVRMGLLWFSTLLVIVDFPNMRQKARVLHPVVPRDDREVVGAQTRSSSVGWVAAR